MKKQILALTLVLFAGAALAADDEQGYIGITVAAVEHEAGNGDVTLEIQGVIPGTGAEAAGLKAHDVLLAIDGTRVVDVEELQEALEGLDAGSVVGVTVLRDGEEARHDVRLSTRPVHAEKRFGVVLAPRGGYLGLELEWLGPQLADYFDVDAGFLVRAVIEGSPAEEAGFAAGDVVVGIEGNPLADHGEARHALAQIEPGQELEISVERRGAARTLLVTAAEPPEHAGHYRLLHRGATLEVHPDHER